MMRGNTLAVVVANRHHEELSQLVEMDNIYFAQEAHALGILEAIEHYDFFGSCSIPPKPSAPTPRTLTDEAPAPPPGTA
jgi:sucrose-phosphate synthase